MANSLQEGESSPLYSDIVILGPEGTGKKTQAKFLKEELGYQIIKRKDLLRGGEEKADFDQVQKFVKRGEPMTCPETARYFKQKIGESIDSNMPAAFINFPKNKEQKKIFDTVRKEQGRGPYAVVRIDAGEESEKVFAQKIEKRTGEHRDLVLEKGKQYRAEIKEVCNRWNLEGTNVYELNPFGKEKLIQNLMQYIAENGA